MSEKKLFAEFPPVSRKEWVDKAIQDLKGADFDKKLVWQTYEGIAVQPFYTEEDIQSLQDFAGFVQRVQRTEAGWINYAGIPAGSSAQQHAAITEAMHQGAEGLLIEVTQPETFTFSEILNDVDPVNVHVSFSLSAPSGNFVKRYFDYLNSRGINLQAIHGFCECDVYEQWLLTGKQTSDVKDLAEQVNASAKAPGFYGLVIRTHAFADAGGNMTQELAFALNKLVSYIHQLTEAGLSTTLVWQEVMFRASITGDYFFEIAKIRALRALLATLQAHYEIAFYPVMILSTTSLWSKSLYDAYTNMLRNTTEGMSAVAGGCDGLLITPHNHHHETFSNRMALNISNILKAESYFNQVTDMAAGSYYVEYITRALYENALTLFRETEQSGGFEKAVAAGVIQEKIKTVRDRKLQDVATRKQVYVGVNQYADPAEKLSLTDDTPEGKGLLTPQRATRAFEQLRKQTQQFEAQTGKPVNVYLAAFGNLAMRKARVAFSQNFFAAAGFAAMEHFHENLIGDIPAILNSDAALVVLCASDEDYAIHAEAFTRAFRQQASNKLLVLAGYPPALVDGLKAAGLDEFIHIRSNAVEVLIALQQQVFSTVKKVQS